MIKIKEFSYKPSDHEAEKAANSYLMSLVVLMGGLPLPIVNLLATLFFYVANRKGTYFVRWHCLQALFSQLFVFFPNTVLFWWTVSILLGDVQITNLYVSYFIVVVVLNLTEFITTIFTAIKTRKGTQVEWILCGTLANLICRPKK